MPIHCLLVDDERLALQLLEAYVAKMPQLSLVAKCENAVSALKVLQQEQVDLLFLDIQMPDLTGLELLRSLASPPKTILTTAYSEHALVGYELDVVDYLLKPIGFERFVQAVNKVQERLSTPEISAPKAESPHFFIKADYKLVKVRYDELLFVEGLREYVRIHTADKRHVTYQSMKNLAKTLAPHGFVRVHRSYIIALNKIDAVYGNTIEIGTHEIPIGKSYKEAFFQQIETLS